MKMKPLFVTAHFACEQVQKKKRDEAQGLTMNMDWKQAVLLLLEAWNTVHARSLDQRAVLAVWA